MNCAARPLTSALPIVRPLHYSLAALAPCVPSAWERWRREETFREVAGVRPRVSLARHVGTISEGDSW